MAEIVVEAQEREALGKNANRRLRVQGKIPAVVYGREQDSQPLTVDPKEISRVLRSEAGQNTILKLRIGKKTQDVLIRDYQLEPIRDTILHADFQVISMDQMLTFQVPIEVVGTAEGVKFGGILDTVLREIELECLPADVPDHIQVDVTELEIGDSLRVGQLAIDTSKLNLLSESELVVLTVSAPAVEEEEEVEEEEVELAEGEEAAPEEGEAPEETEGKEE